MAVWDWILAFKQKSLPMNQTGVCVGVCFCVRVCVYTRAIHLPACYRALVCSVCSLCLQCPVQRLGVTTLFLARVSARQPGKSYPFCRAPGLRESRTWESPTSDLSPRSKHLLFDYLFARFGKTGIRVENQGWPHHLGGGAMEKSTASRPWVLQGAVL